MKQQGERIKQLRWHLEKKKGQRQLQEQQLQEQEAQRRHHKRQLIFHEQAREILKLVGMDTQRQLQFHIGDITSLALQSVFEEPYELKVSFVERRNKSECDLTFVRDDLEVDPMQSSGGGAVDVASFALRIASWSMQQPRRRALMIMDEPLRFLSANYQAEGSAMIKELADRLGLQFIIVSHEPTLTNSADTTIEIGIKNKVSFLKQ